MRRLDSRRALLPKARARLLGSSHRARDLSLDVAYKRSVVAMARAGQRIGSALATADTGVVVVLDIHGMSRINRKHGVGAGDRLLAAIDAALSRTAGPGAAAARLAGDQFVLVLPNQQSSATAIRVTRRALRQAWIWSRCGLPLRARAHIGVAMWWDEQSRERVVGVAGTALKN